MMNRLLRFPSSTAFAFLIAAATTPAVAFAQAPPAAPPPPSAEAAPPEGMSPPPPAPVPAPAGAEQAAPSPGEPAAGGLTNAAGQVSVSVNVAINLSKDAVAKPVNIVPNIYYGVTDKLSLGITHGALPGFPPAGGGLCLGGTDRGCTKVYNNLNLDVLASLVRQQALELAFHGGIDFRRLSDPMLLAVRVGVALKWASGPIAIVFDPSAQIGVNKRTEGNKEFYSIPVHLGFQATPMVSLGLLSGLYGFTPGFGDTYVVPVAIDAGFNVSTSSNVGAQFVFLNLLGKNSTADGRSIILTYNFRS
jgi:hypothetical protein